MALCVLVVPSANPVAGAQDATPAACPTTTVAENEALARRWHDDAINGGDLGVIDEIVSPDVIHHAGTFPDGQGPEAIKSVLGFLHTAFPDTHHTIEQVIASDNFVVTRWSAQGTQQGEFQGIAPTGKTVTWTGINIFRIECGRIAEEWSEVDGLGRVAQLTAAATPAP